MLNLLAKIYSVKKTEHFTAGQVAALQQKRFKKLLIHVLEKSKFYKEYYKKHGVELKNIDSVELKDLPPIDKKIMMEHYDELVCDPYLKRKGLEKFVSNPANRGKKYKNIYQAMHTSGTSGNLGIFVYGPKDWIILKALIMARTMKTKINPFKKIKIASITAIDGNYAGANLTSDAPKLFFNILAIHINDPLQEIIQKLNKFQPNTLSGYSSIIYLVAQEQIKGTLNIKPNKIMCSADPLTLEMRKIIQKAFGINPLNWYAASEALCMAAQCESRKSLHLFTDWHYFEIVDKNLDPVNPGEQGHLLLTNLYNYTQPLIRYRIGDELILDETPCQCKSPFPLIKEIMGRQANFLWFDGPKGKEYIHPLIIGDFFVPGLEKFQILQIEKNKLLIRAIIYGSKEKTLTKIHEKIQGILKEKSLEKSVSFSIEVVNQIPNNPKTGKFEFVIPLKQ